MIVSKSFQEVLKYNTELVTFMNPSITKPARPQPVFTVLIMTDRNLNFCISN